MRNSAADTLLLADFIKESLWAQLLKPAQLEAVTAGLSVRTFQRGAFIAREGELVRYWLGVMDGLVSSGASSSRGKTMSFVGFARGAWFGEGRLLRNEGYFYDAIAVTRVRAAFMPAETFHWLLDSSSEFKSFLINQMSERLLQFARIVHDARLREPEARIACQILSLAGPALDGGGNRMFRISQEEIGRLAGISRQGANRSLRILKDRGLIDVAYGKINILDVDRLRDFARSEPTH